MDKREELTKLGLLGVAPFAIGAVAVWLSPFIFPFELGAAASQITLAYGAVIASYMAGMGAGAIVSASADRKAPLLPSMIATLLAWVAAWPGAPFLSPGAFWRYFLLIGVLVYLLARDRLAVQASVFPNWYGPLRARLTFWASSFLALAAARMLIGAA